MKPNQTSLHNEKTIFKLLLLSKTFCGSNSMCSYSLWQIFVCEWSSQYHLQTTKPINYIILIPLQKHLLVVAATSKAPVYLNWKFLHLPTKISICSSHITDPLPSAYFYYPLKWPSFHAVLCIFLDMMVVNSPVNLYSFNLIQVFVSFSKGLRGTQKYFLRFHADRVHWTRTLALIYSLQCFLPWNKIIYWITIFPHNCHSCNNQ